MATAPVPCPASPSVFYPTTATYAPPIFPGGHYNLPFPYSHGAAPAFPEAATHPYPHPATAFAPPPCFFPAPPFGYPPAPANFPAPEYGPTNFPPIANPYSPVSDSIFSGAATHSTAEYSFHMPASRMQPDHASAALGDHASLLKLQDSEADAVQRHAFDLCLDRLPSSNHHFVTYQAVHQLQQDERDQTLVETIQGQLAKLTSMVSEFTVSLGKQSASAHASEPAQSQHFSTVPAAVHVVPQVFGEMPTPSLWQGTQATTPNCCYGHQTPIESTGVPDGNNNLSEQNVDEMPTPICEKEINDTTTEQSLDGRPQQYSLHNLNCRNVFRAYGTEHSYYALPESYPCEQAIPAPVFDVYDDESDGCSNEFVQVFSDTSEQQPYEEEQQDDDQLPKCFGKASVETEHTTTCSSIISEVPDFTLEMQHQVNEKASVDVPQLRAPPYCLLENDERRKEWDPGVPQEQLQQVHTQEYNLMLTAKGKQKWDPGILITIINGHPVIQWSLFSQDSSHLSKLCDPGASTYLETALKNDSSNDSSSNEHFGDWCAVRAVSPSMIRLTVGPNLNISSLCFEWYLRKLC